MSKTPDWSLEDSDAAAAEGWDLFSTDRNPDEEIFSDSGEPYGYRPWELQRIDWPVDRDEPVFEEDEEAWVFVWRLAHGGSLLHQRALVFLAAHSPDEYRAIEKYTESLALST